MPHVLCPPEIPYPPNRDTSSHRIRKMMQQQTMLHELRNLRGKLQTSRILSVRSCLRMSAHADIHTHMAFAFHHQVCRHASPWAHLQLTSHVTGVPINRQPDPTEKKKQLRGRHSSCDAQVFTAAETRLDGQTSELFLSVQQKLEFGRCSFFTSWSG